MTTDHQATALPDHGEQHKEDLQESRVLKDNRPSDFQLCLEMMTKASIS